MKIKLLFFFLGLLFTSELLACTCGGRNLKEDYKNSTAMVEGRIVSRKVKTRHVSLPNGEIFSYTYYEYKIRVKQMFKGQPGKFLYVATAREGATCGMHFRLGGWYLVSAFADDRFGLYTSRCSTNIRRNESLYQQEIQALAELIKKS